MSKYIEIFLLLYFSQISTSSLKNNVTFITHQPANHAKYNANHAKIIYESDYVPKKRVPIYKKRYDLGLTLPDLIKNFQLQLSNFDV